MRRMTQLRRYSPSAPVVLLTGLAIHAGPVHPEWSADGDAGVAYQSNVSRGQLAGDIKSDTSATVAASARSVFMPGERGAFSLGVDMAGASYLRYHGLSH